MLEHFLEEGALFSRGDGNVILYWGKSTFSSTPQNHSLYFPDFFLENSKPWLNFPHVKEFSLKGLLSLIPKSPSLSVAWEPVSKAAFSESFSSLKALITKGELNKGVPYVMKEAAVDVGEKERLHLLFHLLTHAQDLPLFLYGFWQKDEGMLGATPELLFRREGDICSTVACAGTRPLDTDSDSFLTDPKEAEEHRLVIRGVTEALTSLGKVSIGKRKELVLPYLVHLLTPIQVELYHECPFETIVRALHPTPALGTYPKLSGETWLKSCAKKTPRGRFGAPVGDQTTLAVGIRNLQWGKGRMRLGAGCGVVAASDLEREWNEVQLKITSIENIFQI